MLSDMVSSNVWTRIKREHGLYRYDPSGQYFARVRFHGKLYRRKLDTDDLALAKRKLRDFKSDLERTDATKGNASFAAVLKIYAKAFTGAHDSKLDEYFNALNGGHEAVLRAVLKEKELAGGDPTIKDKLAVIRKLKQTFFGVNTLPLRTVKPSQVTAWLAEHYGDHSASYYNSALSVIRGALGTAVDDKIILESPANGLKYRERKKPIRQTPTFEQFRQIVADIRAQRFNREAEQSGDFVEFLGLAGLGQAEVAGIKRADVDLDAGRIIVYRHKTDTGFAIPIYPQLRPLLEKLCKGKKHDERLFPINEARKALRNACKRLGFSSFTHRSLRRMLVTRALEKGVDVKTIAEWQGHRDGGKLILQTYSHVRPVHSQRMALLMSTDEPANIIPMMAEASQKIPPS
jgi:integrase